MRYYLQTPGPPTFGLLAFFYHRDHREKHGEHKAGGYSCAITSDPGLPTFGLLAFLPQRKSTQNIMLVDYLNVLNFLMVKTSFVNQHHTPDSGLTNRSGIYMILYGKSPKTAQSLLLPKLKFNKENPFRS
jgi:hypothetical protein